MIEMLDIQTMEDFQNFLSDLEEEGRKIEEEEDKVSEEQKFKERKYVILFDPRSGMIQEFKSPADLSRFLDAKIESFYHVLSGREHSKTYRGFKIRWKWERSNDE